MLRSQVWLNQVIAAIRTKVGGRLVVDHEAILNAIKTRKPELARRAMGRPLLGTGFRATRKVLIQAPGGRRFGSMRRAWLNCSMALV